MYGYEWTGQNGIYRLSVNSKIEKEIRPVFKEELDYFDFYKHWTYPDTDAPLLWAEGIRRYILNGTCVAEAIGGGFYTKPTIKIYTDNLTLEPIDIDVLWKENERLMLGLEKTSMDFIRKTHDKYEKKGMAFAVAFSGGKDSLVLLDLVSRALSPDEFSVVFSNTGMELSTTIQSVEKAKKHWSSLKFYEAKSHLKPTDSWEEFGPPGRRMRWCCAVHKSVPTILLLREITGNYNIKAVVFDGVRAEESAARADRDEISVGAKNINQINCSPILKWGTSELFIYLLHNGILFNEAYRKGLFRVGCIVCPMSSAWWDSIVSDCYPDEMRELLSNVESYARATKPGSEVKRFIEQGGWKARMGGRGLQNGGNRVVEKIADDKVSFSFISEKQDWLHVCSILGPVVYRDNDIYTQLIDKQEFQFQISGEAQNIVTYWPYSKMDRFILSHLRGIANKTAYCFGCRACEVQCPVNAFTITENGAIYIREDKCTHCCNCIEFTNGKGCLTAKSLSVTGGENGMDLKGMNRYQHFGLRRPWLEHFFEHKENCFTMGSLGTRQYDSLKVWLKEAGLLTATGKGAKSGVPTPLFDKIRPLGAGHPLTWAVIWTNLVIWKSQATDIKSAIQFMMTMEDAIRQKLTEKFGASAYYGKKSLIAAARDAVNDSSINWDDLFSNQSYALFEEYGSVDDFREEVNAGNLKAANIVARIYRDKGWGFFTSLQMFKDWVADVVEGNNLQDSGIIFIWDEFTSYLRNNPTDDVLQPLSEFCKEQPFFMFLIVHRAPSWVSQIGEEVYEQIVHRYHSLDFHVSESAAYELIGSSILTRAGMEELWNAEKDVLMKSISKNIADFDNLDMSSKMERLRQLCPLHPMTLSLLAIVAQNFGASQRTLFRFMKDTKESEENVGFIYYINNFGPDDWRWLTPDFLWDYFFTRESDVRSFSTEAKNAYQHFMAKREYIADDYHMHVFKAAMLLIAVMSSGTVSNLYSQATQRKVSATRSTLYKCFAGQLTKEDVEMYLSNLEQIGVLRLDAMTNGDMRLQIPYTGKADVFDVRKEILVKKQLMVR